ncbi:MAG: winged helix-turn-helix domain-containing protein [Chloroflexi bacterium]|nr:winged helix-turn-helix domain-containing protein [Chloroflexota bacterium]
MKPITVTIDVVRRYLLAYQGLLPPRAWQGEAGVRQVFDRLGSVQYDPLNLVGRNPDLVLQARVVDYTPELLDTVAYQQRTLYDTWDKRLCLVPITAYPGMHLIREMYRGYHPEFLEEHSAAVAEVLQEIQTRGPLSTLDFDMDVRIHSNHPWVSTNLVKRVLQALWTSNIVLISHRKSNRHYYDLTQRVVPPQIASQPFITQREEFVRWMAQRRHQAMGIIGPGASAEVWDNVGNAAAERTQAIRDLVDAGALIPLMVEGDAKRIYHIPAAALPYLELAQQERTTPAQVTFVAPLDNLLWDRKMISRFFEFDYIWEVYKRAHERQYGYYVLPVLYGERFIARTEMRADRKASVLRILSWRWEDGVEPDREMRAAIDQALETFQQYLGIGALEDTAGITVNGTI